MQEQLQQLSKELQYGVQNLEEKVESFGNQKEATERAINDLGAKYA